MAAIVRTDANGSIVNTEPRSRLVGAANALAMNSATTATVMVIVPRETVTRGPGGTVRSGVSVGGGASADRGVSVVIPCLLRRWAPLRAVIHNTPRYTSHAAGTRSTTSR